MPSFTPKAITNPQHVVEQIHKARKCGYTEDARGHEINVCCIAVLILIITGANCYCY